MKKVILILALAFAAVAPATAEKGENVKITSDKNKTTIIADGDTTEISGIDVPALINDATGALDDTVINRADAANGENEENDEYYSDKAVAERQRSNEIQAGVVKDVTNTILFTIGAVLFFALLFYYLNRRAKYRAMEKAFENGAPLPPSLGGYVAPKVPENDAWRMRQQTPPAPAVTPQAPQNAQAPSASTGAAAPGFIPGISEPSLSVCSKGFTLAAVGLCFMLFFFFSHAPQISMLFMIMVIIGAGKAYAAYRDQKNAIAYQQYVMQQQQQQQPAPASQPEAPAQTAAPEPPVFNDTAE